MQIVNIATNLLKAYDKNAKKHPSDQVAAVAESIKQFGFVQPVVIDKDNIIVIGHCRVMAAKRLKMDEVPCVLVDDLAPEQVNALRLADNKTNESAWDIGLLNDSMVDVGDIDMTVFGFDLGEEQAAVEDDYEPELPEEPKSFIGQVYKLGRHRLMCGDAAVQEAGLTVRQCLIWVKNSMVMGRQDYQWKHEPCLYGWKEGAGHLWASDRKQTTVLEFDRPTRSKEHPTMKPIPLFDYQMQNNTKGGDVVLDLFGGSGTSIIAAEQNGRACYMMEFDPRYIDVIIDRWQKFTGETAVLVDTCDNL